MSNKDYDYYKKFTEQISYSCEAALMLKEVLSNYNTRTIEKKLKEMHTIEHNADILKHEMMKHLASEFIAPIEREDIVLLSQQLDDITDTIEDVLIKAHMYNVLRIKPEAERFADLICKCCEALKSALIEFPNFKKSKSLQPKLIEVNSLEEAGDQLYYDTVHILFCNSNDPIGLYVWSHIFARLEECCDFCERAADTIEIIVMKNT